MHDPSPPANERSVEVSARPRNVRAHSLPTPDAPTSIFVHAFLLAAVSAVVFLAGGPAQGSLGIFLLAAGVVLTFFPARVRIEWPLWLCAAGLLGCSALAFLPAQWFPAPSWRAALAGAAVIHLPSTVTPVPWETGFWLCLLGVSCLTGLFLLAHPVRSRTLLRLAAAAVVVCGLYAALSIYARQAGWHYPFASGATFGFFPNRNHTATFLVTGSIMAMGILTMALRENRWTLGAVAGAAISVCVAGLFFYSGSRGGVIFLLLGTLVWVAGLGGTHRNVPLLVSVAALAVAGGALFLVSGGEARARLLGTNQAKSPVRHVGTADAGQHAGADAPPGNEHDVPLDMRLLIYRDTLDLIRDMPVSGTGLGGFAPVFAQYRKASLSEMMLIHPESDWLMLTAEQGVPALVFTLIGGGLLLVRLRGAVHHPFWPLRWGCVAAAAAAVLHGMADVPAHRVALGWWILVLAGIGFQRQRERDGKSPLIQRAFFVAGGLGALVLGAQLVRAEWFGVAALPPFAAAQAQAQIAAIFKGGDTDGALVRARQAVATSPLATPLYYQLGFLLLHVEDTDAEVDQVFLAERTLYPTWPTIPVREGQCWSLIDPKRTASLWLAALERQRRIDVQTRVPADTARFYEDLLRRANALPAVQSDLGVAATGGPAYALAWMGAVRPEIVRDGMGRIVADADLLKRFTGPEREKMLLLWNASGDRAGVDHFLDAHHDWSEAGWAVHLRRLVDAQEFERAVRETVDHDHISLALPVPVAAASLGDPSTPDGGVVAAFSREWASGNTAGARRILSEAVNLPEALLPPEYWRLKLSLAVQDGAWPSAWQALDRYREAIRAPDSAPH